MVKILSKQLLYGTRPELDEDPYILVRRRPIRPLNASATVSLNYYNNPFILNNTLCNKDIGTGAFSISFKFTPDIASNFCKLFSIKNFIEISYNWASGIGLCIELYNTGKFYIPTYYIKTTGSMIEVSSESSNDNIVLYVDDYKFTLVKAWDIYDYPLFNNLIDTGSTTVDTSIISEVTGYGTPSYSRKYLLSTSDSGNNADDSIWIEVFDWNCNAPSAYIPSVLKYKQESDIYSLTPGYSESYDLQPHNQGIYAGDISSQTLAMLCIKFKKSVRILGYKLISAFRHLDSQGGPSGDQTANEYFLCTDIYDPFNTVIGDKFYTFESSTLDDITRWVHSVTLNEPSAITDMISYIGKPYQRFGYFTPNSEKPAWNPTFIFDLECYNKISYKTGDLVLYSKKELSSINLIGE